MKLIIDIPEETYKEVCWRGLHLCPRDENNLVRAIKNSTPLDDAKAEIEHMIPCGKETLSMKLGVLEILDNIGKESEVQDADSN